MTLSPPTGLKLGGREVVLVDDIASSGETLIAGVALVKQLGAARVRVAVVHALMAEEAVAQFGSQDSGASLGDILGAALKQRAEADKED